MNIFILSRNQKENAQYHCDKHVIKMILESAQLLCNTHWFLNNCAPYRKTHFNHPSSKWVRKSLSNYKWLCELAKYLCEEYTFRYNKIHKTQKVIEWCCQNTPNIPDLGLTYFALAMPEKYKNIDPVKSYRDYYLNEKQHLFVWSKREIPDWIKSNV